MPITLDEFKALPPDEQQNVLAEMRQQSVGRIRAALDEVLVHPEWEDRLVPKIAFRPAPTQTVNLDPQMSDEEVRERFKNDPNLKELTVGGVHYARI